MSEHIGEPLEEYEIEEFLKERSLGVLGLAREGDAYAFPIAFAYDAEGERCILRFIMGENSKKRAFAAQTDIATLATFEWNGKDDWQSIVITGPIETLANEEMAHAAALFSDLGAEAALDIFNEPISEYQAEWYELRATEVTGRGRFRPNSPNAQ